MRNSVFQAKSDLDRLIGPNAVSPPRVRELVRLGILTDADRGHLDDLARSAWHQAVVSKKPPTFVENLDRIWEQTLESDPRVAKMNPAVVSLLTEYFLPLVNVDGRSDAEWMAALLGVRPIPGFDPKPLQSALGNEDPASLVLTAARSSDPAKRAKFEERWRKELGPGGPPAPSSAGYADFESVQKFEGKVLEDEVSYWMLIENDPRFSAIQEAIASGELDRRSAVETAAQRIDAMNEIYAAKAKEPGQICKLLARNYLFADARERLESWKEKNALSDAQANACRYGLGVAYLGYYSDERLARTRAQYDQLAAGKNSRVAATLQTCSKQNPAQIPSCKETPK
jgi:hypothetical protein